MDHASRKQIIATLKRQAGQLKAAQRTIANHRETAGQRLVRQRLIRTLDRKEIRELRRRNAQLENALAAAKQVRGRDVHKGADC